MRHDRLLAACRLNFQFPILNAIEPEVPYSIKVKALNSAGCGEEQQIYCFTQEGGI